MCLILKIPMVVVVRYGRDEKQPGLIRASWQTGTPLGNDNFKQKVEAKLKCKVGQARRGRPEKGSDPLYLIL